MYVQEMPQSQTPDQPMTLWGKDTEHRQPHHKSKATSYLFLSQMIVKLEETPRTTPKNEPNTAYHIY